MASQEGQVAVLGLNEFDSDQVSMSNMVGSKEKIIKTQVKGVDC